MAWFFKYDIPERHDAAMADGSVRFVSATIGPGGEDSRGLIESNLATDQPTESKTLGQPVTFTATISNSPAGGVFVASADLDGSVRDGTSNTFMAGERVVDTWVPIVGDWDGDGRDAVGHDNSYGGSHVLYQDLVVPAGNPDPYVLTSVDHGATDSSIKPELDDQALLMFAHGNSQAGCSPFICGDNSPTVAESQAAHVAISLGDASSVDATGLWPHDLLLL